MQAEGVYKAKITDNGLGKSSTGNFQFQLQIEVTANDEDVPLDRPLKRTIFMAITENTKARVKAELKSIGYDKDTLQAKALIPGNPESFVFKGKEIFVECGHDEYPKESGKWKERWQVCRRKMGLLGREDASQFDSLFGEGGEESFESLPS